MMKRKLLTVALAATMVVSSVFSAFAEDVDCTSSWWQEHSAGVEVDEDGIEITFHSVTNSDAEKNWDTPTCVIYTASEQFTGGTGISDLSGYTEYYLVRSDAYCMTGLNYIDGSYVSVYDEDTFVDWATWLAANQAGVDCTVSATKTADDTVEVVFTNNGITTTATVTVPEDTVIYLSVTGELCTITDLTLVEEEESSSAEEESTTKSSPSADDSEVESTTVSSPSADDSEVDETTTAEETTTEASDDEEETTTASSSDEEETTAAATEAEVIEVTASVATAIAEAAVVTNADGEALDVVLTVSVPDDDAVATATSLVEANEYLTNAGLSAYAVLDLTLTSSDGSTKYTVLGNKISVTIPVSGIFTDIASGDYVAIYRVDTIDNVEQLSYLGYSKVNSNKEITFETNHFSTYVFAVVDDITALPSDIDDPYAGASEAIDPPVLGDTTPVIPLVVLAVVALGGVVAAVASKKRA